MFAVEKNAPEYDGLAMRISRFLITGGARTHGRKGIAIFKEEATLSNLNKIVTTHKDSFG